MYKPQKLILKNFISHQESEFDFHKGRAILVIGENLDNEGQKGNGAGKSTLNEAISLAIVGNSIRNVKPRELIRVQQDSAEVSLLLINTLTNESFLIWRKIYSSTTKSSECKIWINDKEITSCSDINSYNKFILDKIGISKEDFYNFFLITKEQYQPFLAVGDVRKKEIINRFSGADSIDTTTEYIQSDSQEKQLQINEIEKEIVSIQAKNQLLSEQVQRERELISDEKIREQLVQLDYEIGELKAESCSIDEIEVSKTQQKESLVQDCLDLEKSRPKYEEIIKQQESSAQELVVQITNCTQELGRVKDKYSGEAKEIVDTDLECESQLKLKKASILEIEKKFDTKAKETTTSHKEDINLVEESTLDFQKKISQLESKLAGEIQCPHCNGLFILSDKDFNIEDAKEKIENYRGEITLNNSAISDIKSGLEIALGEINKEREIEVKAVQKEIEEIQQIKQEVAEMESNLNMKISKEQESIREKINTLNREEIEFRDKVKELKSEQLKYDQKIIQLQGSIFSIDQDLTKIDNDRKTIKLKIDQLIQKGELLKNKDESKIKELELQIKNIFDKEIELKGKLEKLVLEKQEIDVWITNFKNFKSHLANQSIKNISDYTNHFLSSIGSNITIAIDGYRVLSNKKLKEEITTSVYKDGFEVGSYGKFSAGERGRIDVCCILAIRELVNLNCPSGGLDILILDEVLDSVDTLGLESIINSLQYLGQTIMIVSQNEINSLKENTIVIQKKNGISKIC